MSAAAVRGPGRARPGGESPGGGEGRAGGRRLLPRHLPTNTCSRHKLPGWARIGCVIPSHARLFCFQTFTSLKIPSTARRSPGCVWKGGRAPSHGGFRSRSGTINQTPPSPSSPRCLHFKPQQSTGRGKSAQRRGPGRAGPGGSARAGMRRQGRGGQTHRRPR